MNTNDVFVKLQRLHRCLSNDYRFMNRTVSVYNTSYSKNHQWSTRQHR